MSVDWYGPEIEARIRSSAMRGVQNGLLLVERHSVELILNTAKSGRIYRRGGVVHQASAPGEPPASDTGTLVNARRIELHPETVSGRLIWSSKHAWFLEHGTRNMAARPWARRGLYEMADQIEAGIEMEVRRELAA